MGGQSRTTHSDFFDLKPSPKLTFGLTDENKINRRSSPPRMGTENGAANSRAIVPYSDPGAGVYVIQGNSTGDFIDHNTVSKDVEWQGAGRNTRTQTENAGN